MKLSFDYMAVGNQVLQPMFVTRDYLGPESSGSSGGLAQPINRESDCLISSATVGGYSAMRSQSNG